MSTIKKKYALRGLSTYVYLLDPDCNYVPDTKCEDKCQVSSAIDYSKLTFDELYFHLHWIEKIEKGEESFLGKYDDLCQKPGYAMICWPRREDDEELGISERHIYVCRDHVNTIADLVFGNVEMVPVANVKCE